MTLSGAQAKALTAYGQGMGSQEYQNAYNRYNTDQTNLYNRLAGISGTGLQAGSAIAGVGQNTANQVSSNLMNLGAGQSAAQIAGTNALSSGANTWANWNMAQQLNPWAGYGGGFTGNLSNPYGTTGMIGTGGSWASGAGGLYTSPTGP